MDGGPYNMKKKIIIILAALSNGTNIISRPAPADESVARQIDDAPEHYYADQAENIHSQELNLKELKQALHSYLMQYDDNENESLEPAISDLKSLLKTLKAGEFTDALIHVDKRSHEALLLLHKEGAAQDDISDEQIELEAEETELLMQALHEFKIKRSSKRTKESNTQTEQDQKSQDVKSPAPEKDVTADPFYESKSVNEQKDTTSDNDKKEEEAALKAEALAKDEDDKEDKKHKDRPGYYGPQPEQPKQDNASKAVQKQPQRRPNYPNRMPHQAGYRPPMHKQTTGPVGGSKYNQVGFTVHPKQSPKGKDSTREEIEATVVPEGTVQVSMPNNKTPEAELRLQRRIIAKAEKVDHKRRTERTSSLKIRNAQEQTSTNSATQKKTEQKQSGGIFSGIYHTITSWFSWIWSKVKGK
jgi:hypothetical protein